MAQVASMLALRISLYSPAFKWSVFTVLCKSFGTNPVAEYYVVSMSALYGPLRRVVNIFLLLLNNATFQKHGYFVFPRHYDSDTVIGGNGVVP